MANSLNNLALVLRSKGAYDEAEPLLLESLDFFQEKQEEELIQQTQDGVCQVNRVSDSSPLS